MTAASAGSVPETLNWNERRAISMADAKRRKAGREVPRRPLGRTGAVVSALGLGGYHLAGVKSEREVVGIVHEAIDNGITFMDNAWEYHEGKSERLMGKALAGGWRDKVFLMTKVCSHGRGRATAMAQLEESLRRLRTDWVDLWQVHEVVYANDPERHYAKGGVLEALEQAKQQGKVRFAGFTGHKDAAIHLDMIARGFPFDTCQLPLNCFDATFRSFETQVLPVLARRGIAAIGMKPFGGKGDMLKKKAVSAKAALSYAMSLDVAVTVTGIDSRRVLRQDLAIARGFTPMSGAAMDALRRRCAEKAADGRFELYKTSMRHDGPIGRDQHGFPSDEELGA
jgi:aryl-alcohol dehydrogenase-like predicted oxidoreductase